MHFRRDFYPWQKFLYITANVITTGLFGLNFQNPDEKKFKKT